MRLEGIFLEQRTNSAGNQLLALETDDRVVEATLATDAGPLPAWCFINPGTQPTYQGPYLLDTDDGHTYRIISTDGVLSTTEVA